MSGFRQWVCRWVSKESCAWGFAITSHGNIRSTKTRRITSLIRTILMNVIASSRGSVLRRSILICSLLSAFIRACAQVESPGPRSPTAPSMVSPPPPPVISHLTIPVEVRSLDLRAIDRNVPALFGESLHQEFWGHLGALPILIWSDQVNALLGTARSR